jgi:hypothetical protein
MKKMRWAMAAMACAITSLSPGQTLPNAPEKLLVMAYCMKCHSLAWIERSGGTQAGWTERIRRMNRAGAMIPPDNVPAMAAYLAKALPERLRPVPALPVVKQFGAQ